MCTWSHAQHEALPQFDGFSGTFLSAVVLLEPLQLTEFSQHRWLMQIVTQLLCCVKGTESVEEHSLSWGTPCIQHAITIGQVYCNNHSEHL